jgi:nucleoside-diphosphate-sugar epimerase
MKVFITGATGFIGTHFLRSPSSSGHDLVALRREGSRPCLPLLHEPSWLVKPMDALGASDLAGCEAIIHFASPGVSPKQASWVDLLYWNVTATLRLVETAKAAGVRRVVVAGTYAEYGRSADRYDFIPTHAPLEPTYAYAASKAAASVALSAYAIEKGMELAYLRVFSVFGQGQYEGNFWPALRKAALASEDFAMTPGQQIRDYIPVEQVAEQFWRAVTRAPVRAGVPFVANVASGRPVTIKEFAEQCWRDFGATGRLKVGALPYRPNEVMRFVPEVTPL